MVVEDVTVAVAAVVTVAVTVEPSASVTMVVTAAAVVVAAAAAVVTGQHWVAAISQTWLLEQAERTASHGPLETEASQLWEYATEKKAKEIKRERNIARMENTELVDGIASVSIAYILEEKACANKRFLQHSSFAM